MGPNIYGNRSESTSGGESGLELGIESEDLNDALGPIGPAEPDFPSKFSKPRELKKRLKTSF